MTAYAVRPTRDNQGLYGFGRACAVEHRPFAGQHVIQQLRQRKRGCFGAVDGFRRLRLPQFSVLIWSHGHLLLG